MLKFLSIGLTHTNGNRYINLLPETYTASTINKKFGSFIAVLSIKQQPLIAMGNVFDKEGNELKTPLAFHPGEFLLEEVEERGLKKVEFAKRIGLLPGNLSELFKGKRHINARIAIKLERVLGVSAEFWMGLQSAYDLTIARELEYV